MKINLKKDGGFVGISAKKSMDINDLSDDERKAFDAAVENPPADTPKERGLQMRDVTSYEIKVKKGTKMVTLKYDDTTIPEQVYLMFQKYL